NANVALDPKTLDPLFGDLTNEIFVNEPYTKNVGLVAATLDLNLGWGDLTSATAYLNTRTDQRFDVTLAIGELPLLLGFPNPGNSAQNVFDVMVRPSYKLGKVQLRYVRIATGYQPGGPNGAAPVVPPTVNSSTVTSYEGGLKSEYFDHRLLFDIAGYHISWQDIQVSKVVNNIGALVNAGKAETNGVELTIGFEPIKNLRF